MEDVTIKLTAEQAEQFKKEGKITIEMPKEEVNPRLISGWFVSTGAEVHSATNCPNEFLHHNIYATKEQAEASIAQARLTQEMKLVNGDWVAEWDNILETKYVIYFVQGKPEITSQVVSSSFLHFKDRPTAEKFLSDHYDLIMAYKPLA